MGLPTDVADGLHWPSYISGVQMGYLRVMPVAERKLARIITLGLRARECPPARHLS